jgi:uncharacterized membrane protein
MVEPEAQRRPVITTRGTGDHDAVEQVITIAWRAHMPTILPSNRVKASAGRIIPMAEKHTRSLAKAISWRVVGTLDTVLISFLLTGEATVAVSIGVVELFTKIALYYLHERAWARLSVGETEVHR